MQFNTNTEGRERVKELFICKIKVSLLLMQNILMQTFYFQMLVTFLSLTKGLCHYELTQWQARVSHEDDLCPFASVLKGKVSADCFYCT